MNRAFFVAVPVRQARRDGGLAGRGGEEILRTRLEEANLSGEGCTMLDVVPAVPEKRKFVVHNGSSGVQAHGPEINVRCARVFPSGLVPVFCGIACKVDTEYTTLGKPISIPISDGRAVKGCT